jgi:DNA polymerase-4
VTWHASEVVERQQHFRRTICAPIVAECVAFRGVKNQSVRSTALVASAHEYGLAITNPLHGTLVVGRGVDAEGFHADHAASGNDTRNQTLECEVPDGTVVAGHCSKIPASGVPRTCVFAYIPNTVYSFSIVTARICCLDLDTFFVSVERLFDPTLVGKPVVVGGIRGDRGVVTAASYEARAFGIRSGMSLRDADRLAPRNAIFLPTRHGVYGEYSERVRAVLDRYTPEVRAASIDEFYMDFNGCEELYRKAPDESDDSSIERTVREMRARIRAETGLPASAGVGTSRVIAKVASGLAKPEGVLFVPNGGERAFLLPLPVRKLPGIGPKTEACMAQDDIHTLAELVQLPTGPVRAKYGRILGMLERELAGTGGKPLGRERPAFSEHDPYGLSVGSISNERTFFHSLYDEERVLAQLLALAERVCHRARKRKIRARTVTLKLRYSDFHTINRSRTIEPTSDEAAVQKTLVNLYRSAKTRKLPIRLLGVQLSNLLDETPEQLKLRFARRRAVGAALDTVRERFGYDSLHLAESTRPNTRR